MPKTQDQSTRTGDPRIVEKLVQRGLLRRQLNGEVSNMDYAMALKSNSVMAAMKSIRSEIAKEDEEAATKRKPKPQPTKELAKDQEFNRAADDALRKLHLQFLNDARKAGDWEGAGAAIDELMKLEGDHESSQSTNEVSE